MKQRGYTLVELTIVVLVLGVVLGAVYMFFLNNSGSVESVASENFSASGNRLTLDEIEGYLGNAGYTGEFPPDTWHPVQEAGQDRITIVENIENPGSLGAEDTLTICSDENGLVTVSDASGRVVSHGAAPAGITFSYGDSNGDELDGEILLSQAGRDRIRKITCTLNSNGTDPHDLTRVISPRNLRISGYNSSNLRRGTPSADGETDYVSFFDEDWETGGNFNTEDYIEADWVWVPVLEENFETESSWLTNWVEYSSEPAGRIQRSTSYPHEGSYSMILDRNPYGDMNQNGAIWFLDLSGYDESVDNLRLHFYMREFGDDLQFGDGVFFPDFLGGVENQIIAEDFSGYLDVPKDGWEYWSDTYGNIVIDDAFSYPSGGNYLNLDSRRTGSMSRNRVMWTEDLSSYSTNTDLQLRFSYCSRGDESQPGPAYESDFYGIGGAGGINADPVASAALEVVPSGSWQNITVDLDSMVPAGYNWSELSLMFGQSDDGRTISASGDDGISFDNMGVFEFVASDTQFNDRLYAPPGIIPAWLEVSIDLDDCADSFSRPFSADYPIAFCQYDDYPIGGGDGLAYDDIAVEVEEWGIPGWTHGTFPGYSTDEWVPSNHDHYQAASGPGTQQWCWSVAGSGNYSSGVTRAYCESPEVDLTSYPAGERLSLAFFHYYDWSSGDGCNVKIWSDATGTWELAVPYWGYYTASIAALDGEPGWNGSKSDWNFCVIDITEYAGQRIKARFNYGTTGSGTADGWNFDYFRVRQGPDWPQIIWFGWPNQEYADWSGWSTPPGSADPNFTPNGSRSAGNDMSTWSPWDTEYENDCHNALVSPPITFNSSESYNYIQFMNCLRTENGYDTATLEMAPHKTVASDTAWVTLGAWSGYSSNWWDTRIWLDPYFAMPQVDTNTVIFRWRMQANGSGNYGGWNIDSIRCFSSNTFYSDLVAPVGTDAGNAENSVTWVDANAVVMPDDNYNVMPVINNRRLELPDIFR